MVRRRTSKRLITSGYQQCHDTCPIRDDQPSAKPIATSNQSSTPIAIGLSMVVSSRNRPRFVDLDIVGVKTASSGKTVMAASGPGCVKTIFEARARNLDSRNRRRWQ